MANTQNLDLVKPIGTDHALVSDLNGNSDKIDAYAGKVNTGLDGLRDGIAILADGNTHAAITSGQFVYVKNHQTLPEGLYQASANIAANGTLSTSNLTSDPNGGLNTLSEQIGNLVKKYTGVKTTDANGQVSLAFSDLGLSSRPQYVACTSYMPDVFCEYIFDNSSSSIMLRFNDRNGTYANTPVRFAVMVF